MSKLAIFPAIFLAIVISGSSIFAEDIPLDGPYIPGRVFFKVTPEYKVELPLEGSTRFGVTAIDLIMDRINAERVERTFPHCEPPIKNGTDLTRIYTLYFSRDLPVEPICKDLEKLVEVEYAEPWYIYREHPRPNDPYRGSQYGLDLVESDQAHDIATGDRSVPVGIIDSGVDMDHTDLVNNIWVNPGEDLNGDGVIQNDERNNRDDDHNGKTDDFYGWDFYSNDNNPDDTHGHGTHCAGIASAVTDNRIGVASVGHSCGIMAIRAGTGGIITHGYYGIRYAADTGAKVVSCSWGGYDRSDALQDVVNYAYERDVMIFASAGNDGVTRVSYPAGYDNVISVAAVGSGDRKAGYSNYGEWIGVSAPGSLILSTYPGNRLAEMSGTSMSSPFAASVAILIRATFPRLNVDEATQMLLDGADDIDDVNRNYRGLLGAGRVNAYQSLMLGQRPVIFIEAIEVTSDDNNNHRMDPNETVHLTVELSNSEDGVATESVEIMLFCADDKINILTDMVDFPNIEPGERMTNRDDPFIVEISPDAIPHTIWMTVTAFIEPGGIELEKEFEMVVGHPDILIVDDDDGDIIELFYTYDIEEMGQGWVRWDVAENLAPEVDVLLDHDMVIWVTGNSNPPLDDFDLWQLESALEEGANVLLIGHRIGDYEMNRQVLSNYFGVQHEADSVQAISVRGFSGDRPLSDNVSLYLFGDAAEYGNQSPSSMSPVRGADNLLSYYSGNQATGLAAVYRVNGRTDSRTIHFGFAFEGTSGPRTPRSEILRQLYSWFTADEVHTSPLQAVETVVEFALNPAFPNPFNSFVNLEYSLPSRMSYSLRIIDAVGREVDEVGTGYGMSGIHTISWNAAGIPSGVYFARLSTHGRASVERRLVLVK